MGALEDAGGGDDGPDVVLKPQTSYLLGEPDYTRALSIFRKHCSGGWAGLAVSRQKPSLLRDRFSLEGIDFIWLTSNIEADPGGGVNVSPTSITKLSQHITTHLEKNSKALVLLMGLEYLITHNGFKSVINLIYLLNDKIMAGDNVLMVCINPDAHSTLSGSPPVPFTSRPRSLTHLTSPLLVRILYSTSMGLPSL
jgi:hypothetical protein